MAMTCQARAGKLLTVAAFLSLTLEAYAVWEACNGVSGTCIDTRSHTCTVGTLTGRCPGASYNRCCPSTGGIATSGCTANEGLCKRTATCTSGITFTGLCPGPSTVTCCSQFTSAPAPSNNFANDLVKTANNEHTRYRSLDECTSSVMSNRIGEYWSAINFNRNGCSDYAWSAAFISFMIRSAGGGSRFRYSGGHYVYIHDAFSGGRGLYGSVVDAKTASVKTGDLLCSGRKKTSNWKYANFVAWFNRGGIRSGSIRSHCDIVVKVSGNTVTTIGGNLGGTVKSSTKNKSSYAIVLPVQ